VLADIRRDLAKFPGAVFSVHTFLTERINEILSGYTGAVVVNIFGTNLNTLDEQARRVAGMLAKVRELTASRSSRRQACRRLPFISGLTTWRAD
jgi:Cu/Ag efflux pump CusA